MALVSTFGWFLMEIFCVRRNLGGEVAGIVGTLPDKIALNTDTWRVTNIGARFRRMNHLLYVHFRITTVSRWAPCHALGPTQSGRAMVN